MNLPGWDNGGAGPEVELGPWDTLVLGGIKLPGRAKIHARRGRKHDLKEPRGVDGGTFTDQGSRCAELDITVTVWTSAQLDDLVAVLDRVLPSPKKIAAQSAANRISERIKFFAANPDPTEQELLNDFTGVPGPNSSSEQTNSSSVNEGTNDVAFHPVTSRGEALGTLTISHPSLARLRVRTILITEEENLQPGHEEGTIEWRCRAVEWMGKGQSTVVSTADGSAPVLQEQVANGVPVDATPPSTNPADSGPN